MSGLAEILTGSAEECPNVSCRPVFWSSSGRRVPLHLGLSVVEYGINWPV